MPAGGSLRLEDLYRRHAPEARRLAYLLTGDRAEADDVVQDAFVKLAGRLFALRSPDASGAYLRRVVVNTVLSRSRSRRRELARQDRSARLSGVGEARADEGHRTGPCGTPCSGCPSASGPPSCCATGSTSPRSAPPSCSAAPPAR